MLRVFKRVVLTFLATAAVVVGLTPSAQAAADDYMTFCFSGDSVGYLHVYSVGLGYQGITIEPGECLSWPNESGQARAKHFVSLNSGEVGCWRRRYAGLPYGIKHWDSVTYNPSNSYHWTKIKGYRWGSCAGASSS